MKGLLVSGGKKPRQIWVKKIIEDFDFVVCADSGISILRDLDIIPDMVVGDLDSANEKDIKYIREKNILLMKLNPKKDGTDTEFALEYMIDKDIKNITMVSALGSRVDHSLGNILLLKKLHENNICGKIIDENNEIIYGKEEKIVVEKGLFKYLSIIPISERLVYSTEGMMYEVENLNLEMGSSMGISNEILNNRATVNIIKGSCLIIKSVD